MPSGPALRFASRPPVPRLALRLHSLSYKAYFNEDTLSALPYRIAGRAGGRPSTAKFTSQDGVFRFQYSTVLVRRAAPPTGAGDICGDAVSAAAIIVSGG